MFPLLLVIAGFCALVTALLAVPPGVIGPSVEEQVRAAVAQADQHPFYRASIATYERDWFGARGRLVFGFDEAYAASATAAAAAKARHSGAAQAATPVAPDVLMRVPLILDFELSHGFVTRLGTPRPGLVSARITSAPKVGPVAEALAAVGADYLLRAEAHVSLDGDLSVTARIPPGAVSEDGNTFDFSGADMAASFVAKTGEFDLTMLMEELVVQSADGERIRMRGVKSVYDSVRLDEYLWVGNGRMTIAGLGGRVPVQGAGGEKTLQDFEIRDFGLTVDTSLEEGGETLALSAEYFARSFEGGDAKGSFRVPFALSHVDVGAMQAYAKLVADPPVNPLDPAAAAALPGAVMPVAESFMSRSPSLRVGPASVAWNGESIEVDVRVDVDGEQYRQVGMTGLLSPAALGTLLTATADADLTRGLAEMIAERVLIGQLSEAAAQDDEQDAPSSEQIAALARQQVPAMLGQLQSQGFLAETESGYSASVRVAPEGIKLNGMPIPLGMLTQ